MPRNIGSTDRNLRALTGVVLIALAAFGGLSGIALYLAAIFGVIMLATSAIRFCPLYTPFKLNTCKREDVSND